MQEESLALQSVASQFPNVLYRMRTDTVSKDTEEHGGKSKARSELIHLIQDKFRNTPLPVRAIPQSFLLLQHKVSEVLCDICHHF